MINKFIKMLSIYKRKYKYKKISYSFNGVDIIILRDNLIVEFKVMVRPLKAINMVHQKMMAMLQAAKS